MPDFIHLHNHSDFSLLDGAAGVTSMARRAAELRMPGLAITDHGNLFGAHKFMKACREAGINGILGCEFYMAGASRFEKTGTESGNKYYHLILLAKDAEGWKNLVQLSSLSYTEGFYYKPRIDEETLIAHARGLVCSTACIGGEIPQLILSGRRDAAVAKAMKYRDVFGAGSFFLELQDHGIPEERVVNRELVDMSKRTGLPLVATNDMHYLEKADAQAHDILLCVGTGKKVSDVQRMRFPGSEFFMKTADEMAALFGEVPESLSNTMLVNEMCHAKIPMPGPLLPDFEIPPAYDGIQDRLAEPEAVRVRAIIDALDDVAVCRPNPKSRTVPATELAGEQRALLARRFELPVTRYFIRSANEGLSRRYRALTPEILRRLDYELAIIVLMDFVGYFLIVADFINWAKDRDIPVGPGRGSGAGSIVAYSLRITDVEPLKYDLLFERFLNPERISMPDFDVDFCFERRGEVIDYVTAKYGTDRVGQILTFGTLKAKVVLKDVARALDIPFDESNAITKLVPEDTKMTLAKAFDLEPRLAEYEAKYPDLFTTARKLEQKNRHTSFHPAGIVIGKTPLTDFVPLFRDAKTGAVATQFTMDILEDCGLVKMDLLGLKTLTLIRNTLALLGRRGVMLREEDIPEDDRKTYGMLGEGRSTSVFQFESQGMQGILKQAKPGRMEDLIALNALYRPGPMAYIPQFIEGKWGRKPVEYPDPCLEPILKETYGVIVYQEQVMEVAQRIAGYTLGQADMLRRAMGKKKKEILDRERVPFVAGALKNGFSEADANRIYDILVPFAEYGFNKSHAAAYSVVAYRTAYLKANYPAEFMAANLTNEIADSDKLTDYIAEARSMGIELDPPDVNRSDRFFSVVEGRIVYGLLGIKGVGDAVARAIVAERERKGPYAGFLDFLGRLGSTALNRKVLESLALAGCFDSTGPNRRTIMSNIERAVGYVDNIDASRAFGQASLFESSGEEEFPPFEFERTGEFPRSELLGFEKELLGFFFSGHPMDEYRKVWERCADAPVAHPARAEPKRIYTAVAMLREFREIVTKAGKKMAFGRIEDFEGSMEIVVFSDILDNHRQQFQSDAVLCLCGTIDLTRDNPSFRVEKVENPENLRDKSYREIHVRLTDGVASDEALYPLRDALVDMDGPCSVVFHVPSGQGWVAVRANEQIKLSPSDDALSRVAALPCVTEVWKD
ncbi:MAG: DNA polymerase III subunit alpha [Spirochaetes bacterium]|nr:DNA polymerase III subunit alpha [Spirochaetota bacterium]